MTEHRRTSADDSSAQVARDGRSLPLPEPTFEGQVDLLAVDSAPAAFPQPPRPPESAPNVVLILLDDVGFGHPSTFGGPVPMPTLQRLADRGLRYNRMHTAAMCSPTRAALLTGRNHHSVASGVITHWATGYPGYHTMWPKSSACVAEVLKQHGYSTAALGKWHNTPQWEEGPMGPFDRWPTGLGFEYFYGFLGSDTSQFRPSLVEGTRPVDPPATPEAGYHLDADLADHAIDWVRAQRSNAGDRPFFLYYAPGAAHGPHHAPAEWLERFRGAFDHGWDRQREITFEQQVALGVIPPDTELTPRPAEIPAWDSLDRDEQLLACRLQEAYVAMLAHCDHQVGRVIDELERLGVLDDTLIMFIAGDNGPAAEATDRGQVLSGAAINGHPESVASQLERLDTIGTELANNNYPAGWGWAGATPMQWVKQIASHFGGTRNGMVVSWPRRIVDHSALRTQFHHCIDIVPTILEAAGVPAPQSVNGVPQRPIEGTSMVYTFDDADVASRRRQQYFEMMGHRALYRDGWVAGARHRVLLPWQQGRPPVDAPFDQDPWELYHVDTDFSQARDLAREEPGRLRRMQDLFWAEAARFNVLPLDDRLSPRLAGSTRPGPKRDGRLVFHGGVCGIPEGGSPNVRGRSHRISADVTVPESGAEGILVAQGGRFGGYCLYLQDGALHYVHNFLGLEVYRVSTPSLGLAGACKLAMEFTTDEPRPGAGGSVRLYVDGQEVAHGRAEQTVPFQFSTSERLNFGRDFGTPVDERYVPPFRFTGELRDIVYDVHTELPPETAADEAARLSDAAIAGE